ncbi:MAG: hypothetical protein D3903_20930 [Candidatus Electrothrix sp. GM3_4]|nr:hypothetical protein [Candidatus Electrothrix sp. GM3_4]
MLLEQYARFEGELRFRAPVAAIINKDDKVQGIRLENGEEITADAILSTVGIPGTAQLSGWPLDIDKYIGRMTFMETISMIPDLHLPPERSGRTILFYSLKDELRYHQPVKPIDPSWGVICFPDNFQGLQSKSDAPTQVRVTNAANYELWRQAAADREQYRQVKEECGRQSAAAVSEILGDYTQGAVFQDSFTPMTIERFTEKCGGAVYGSPIKIKSGRTPWQNLFIAGTDQGYLGIVGSMLSGVTIVNQHLLA